MKNTNTKTLALVVTASLSMIACNPLKDMTKRADEVTYSVTPKPLEMRNDSIEINISANIPPRYFNKKVSVDIVPNLKYAGGEKSYKTITLVGEDSEVEGIKINYEKGGTFTYTDRVAFVNGMEDAELFANAKGMYKGKEKSFDPKKLADGTIVTTQWLQNEDMPIEGDNKFQKVIPQTYKATINYLVNSSNVSSSEMNDKDMKEMAQFIKNGKAKGFKFKSTDVIAWASPEGEISLNENLANNRASSGASATNNYFSRNGVKAANDKAFYNKTGKGEDWDGFKSAMQASNIEDKNLILRVLEMYEDKNKREEEIRNLAKTFEIVEDQILPQLRRSEITINAELKSKSDEIITKLAISAPDTLTANELLYAATLESNMDKKLAIYKSAERVYPKDWRGFNNAGFIYAQQNNLEKAKVEFNKAAKLAPSEAVINNNLGMVARLEGDYSTAMDYYNKADGAGEVVGYNKGLIQIKEGAYSDAVGNYGEAKTFNAALAQTMNKDYQKALKTLDGSDAATTAKGHYLKAIIGSRMKDKSMMLTNLKAAISQDASLKAKAKRDAEFLDYRGDSEFQAAVN